MTRHTLTLDCLTAWKDQPRRTFDEAEIEKLAISIQEKGLLQNLVARIPDDDYQISPTRPAEVIAGGSRLAAMVSLMASGRTIAGNPAAEYPIAVEVLAGLSDADALELATIENVQRNDLTPLEEADALTQLVDMGRDTGTLADKVGRTRRYVQLQLELSRKLCARGREHLAAGTITLAAARVLATAPEPDQVDAIPRIVEKQHGWNTGDAIKRSLFEKLLTVDKARFKTAEYEGDIATDPDDDRIRWFTDRMQSERLQRAWMEAEAERLEKKYSTVEMIDNKAPWEGTQAPWQWRNPVAKDDPRKPAELGAVIVINNATLEVEVHERIEIPTDPEERDAQWEAQRKEHQQAQEALRGGLTPRHIDQAQKVKEQALAHAMARSPHAAKAALVALFAGAATLTGAEAYIWEHEDSTLAEDLAELRKAIDARAHGKIFWSDEAPMALGWDDASSHALLLESLLSFSEPALDQALATVTANALGYPGQLDGTEPLGTPAVTTMLAKATDAVVQLRDHFTIDAAWTADLTPAQLVALAEAIGAPSADESALHGHALPDGWLPPELAFGTHDEVLARIQSERPSPAADEAAAEAPDITDRQGAILQAIHQHADDDKALSVATLQELTRNSTGAISQERKALRNAGLLDADNRITEAGTKAATAWLAQRDAEDGTAQEAA